MKSLFNLSNAQKRIYIDQMISPDSCFANIAYSVIFRNNYDAEVIKKALNSVIGTFDSIRLKVTKADDEPLQYVEEHHDRDFEVFEFPSPDHSEYAGWAGENTRGLFEVHDSELFYFAVVRFKDGGTGLYAKFHHFIHDGFSAYVLVNKIEDYCAAIAAGKTITVTAIPAYADFVRAENEYLVSADFIGHRDYWLEKLSPPPEENTFFMARKKIAGLKTGIRTFKLKPGFSKKIVEHCKNNHITRFVFFLSAVSALFAKISANNDVAIGFPHNGRYGAARRICGMFVSTVAYRARIDEDMAFIEYAGKVSGDVKDIIGGPGRYPFNVLAQDLKKNNHEFKNLLDINLVELPGVKNADVRLNFHVQPEDPSLLTIYLNPNTPEGYDELEIIISYKAEFLSQEEVGLIFERMEHVVEQVIASPAVSIKDISVLPDSEKQRALVDFNDTKIDFPFGKTIHELFADAAAAHPEKTALVFREKKYTYRQLDEITDRLANFLRKKGVKPNTVSGILVKRSEDIIIAMLGIIKAGGGYVPIDPGYPDDRIEYMLEDSGAVALLGQAALKDRAKGFKGEWIDLDAREYMNENQVRPVNVNKPCDLLYVIYTSGSTGKPKGVMIEHRNLVNLCKWQNLFHEVTADDVAAAYSGFSFDASIWEMTPFITCGAELHIIADELRLSSEDLNDYFNKNNVTITNLPTQFCEQFMESVENYSLKTLVTGGDKLRTFRPSKFRLVNEYGPTEYTISATAFVVDKMYDNIPIGRPLANTWLYVVDKSGNPVPIGVAGELWISGAQIARGYLNRPELTREKFVDNPFKTCEINSKLYKTGDLVRWTTDGNIEFLGRIDQQVKIRGYRIELGEIEQQLLKIENIKDAVVVDIADPSGNKYLSAYIVVQGGAPDIGAIKKAISKELPEYMVPAYFTAMERIPLTPNGKVDRRALPVPELKAAEVEYIAPTGEIEAALADIWRNILNAGRVGARDNFFDLGGHSLKASLLQSKVQKILRVKITLADIFENPTIQELAKLIKGLSKSDLPTLSRAGKMDRYPLSAAQMSMYFLGKDEESSVSYNIPLVNLIIGKVDRNKLEEAIRKIIERHEALRTRFEDDAARGAVQAVEESVRFNLEYAERQIDDSSRFDEFINAAANEYIRRFDLSMAPLIRGALVKFGEDKYLLTIDAHHIIFDGTSASLFFEELDALYIGEEIPPPEFQYRDYLVWEKLFKESAAYKKQEKYWLDRFSGELPVLNLATDFPRPAKQNFEGNKHYFTIDKKLLDQIQALANRGGATLYHVLLAAWYTVLYRYTGQNDIIVGSPVAGRAHPDLAGVMGMFVNTIAMRAFPDGNQPFSKFLNHVRGIALEAMDNQYYEFIELVAKLIVRRDGSRNPIFDTMFVLQNAGDVNFNNADFKMAPWKLQNKVSQVDLTLEAEVIDNKLEVLIEYCVKLFRPETIERMAKHFINILRTVVRDADISLDKIGMLEEAEKKFLLCDLNDTFLPVPFEKTIPRLFKETAVRYGDKIALVCGDTKYTYEQLDRKTDALAALLREKGVTRDRVAAIMVRRSADIMVAALSVMKAGGAYLPIDPDYPQDRIGYMLQDSGALMLLSHKELSAKASGFGGEWLDLEDEKLYSGDGRLELINKPQDLAYIIYTSGSTGKPKGVMIEHRNLNNLCAWHNHYHKVTSADNAAAYSGFGFDASIWEMFPFITCGAALHIIREDIRLAPDDINEYFTRNNITITNFPTQFCEQFMEITDNRTLKTLVTGGDKLRSFRGRGYRLVNEYGPTEYTVSATVFPVDRFYDNIPIGRPLANTWLYILDRAGNPVPAGVPGELCIAGAQMARGYLNRPELTAEKFIKNPFAVGEMNSTLYKTGDLVRYLPDGNIEFLGRIDQQVKIRGYRIELGEIEQQLMACLNVKDALVIDRADSNGVKYLCAYIVGATDESEIKKQLALILPDYMVPSTFVFIERIPLTPNGKVDKRALPLPEPSSQSEGPEYVAARSEREKILAGIWKEVLAADRVGVNDNFFSLGGDSIKSIQASARLKKFNFRLDTKKLFATPTIAQLADQLETIDAAADNSPVSGPVALTPIQRWFFAQNFKKRDHWNQSTLLRASRPVEEAILNNVLREIVRHHDALRMTYRFDGEKYEQFNRDVDEGKLFELRVFSLSASNADEAAVEIGEKSMELQRGIDLSNGPLLQAGLFKGDPGKGVCDHVAIVIHHLVVDGVSWDIILQDLESAYEAASTGKKIEFADKSSSFKEWSEKLGLYSKSREISKTMAYWKNIDGTKIDPLPVDDREPKSAVNADIVTEKIGLSVNETAMLFSGCQNAYGMKTNEILLSGLILALKTWSGGAVRRTAVTMEGHGREELINASVNRTVGWFTATYPVVISAESNDLKDLLIANKENIRHIPDRGLAYEIIHELTPPEMKSGWPGKIEPEIEFNHLGEIKIESDDSGKNVFCLAGIGSGGDSDAGEASDFKLYFTTSLTGGALNVSIGYNKWQYRDETMKTLAGNYRAALNDITRHCDGRAREYTPSDIADSALTIGEFNFIRSIYGDNIEKIYPLAPMQEGMLFINISEGKKSSSYLEQSNFELTGEMDEALFTQNFARMISRYDILRTCFVIDGLDRMRQVVLKNVETPVAFYDLRGLPSGEQSAKVELISSEERKRGFDMARAPLFKAAVLRLSENKSVVVVSFMHIIIDGWSMALIEKALFSDYCSLKSGKRPDEPKTVPYGDYIEWLESQDKQEACSFWREYLAGINTPTVIPNKKQSEKSVSGPNFADRHIEIPAETVSKLQAIGRRNNVTIGIMLQAIWGIMLMRYNRSDDAVFGLVVSGRSAGVSGIEDIIGLFINTIPVRVSAGRKTTFVELVRAMQENALRAEKYSYLSLAEIQSQSSLRGNLINTFLTLQTFADKSLPLADGFSLREESGFDQVSYDFSVVMVPAGSVLVRFNYNAAAYDENFIELVCEHLAALVDEIVMSPDGYVDGYNFFAGVKKIEYAEKKSDEDKLPLPDQTSRPVTCQQKRIYVYDRMRQAENAFHVTTGIALEGDLDRRRLSRAIDAVVKRHEALRTTFEMVDGEPVQRVNDFIKLKKILKKVDESDIESAIGEFIKPFDLSRGPLISIMLLEVAKKKHILVMDAHHIIIDRLSLDIFYDELLKIYDGVELEAVKCQYGDYARWEKSGGFRKSLMNQEFFWKEVFSAEVPVLNLPQDHPRPAVKNSGAGIVSFGIDHCLTSKLKGLCAATDSTMFTLILAALNLVMHKYSGNDDIVIGTACSGRVGGEFASSVGMFVNMIPLRNFPSAQKTFRSFLGEVKKNTVDALDNQLLPFDRLVETLEIDRDPSRNPIFDLTFNYSDEAKYHCPACLKVDFREMHELSSHFDIEFEALEKDGGINLSIIYATALFDRETIERMSEHIVVALKEASSRPDEPIKDISILPEAEKNKLLMEFNDTFLDVPFDKTIHELFEEAVEASPDKVALVYKGNKYTYRRLDEITNRLASYLRKKGVKPNTVSGIIVNRSEDIIIAMLGIIKAGGGYVPIDPGYPDDRINYMLEDSGAVALMGHGDMKGRVTGFKGEWIDLEAREYMAESADKLSNVNKPDDLLYVIYTSGSTGKPKGVMIEHRNLVNLCKWHNKFHGVTSADNAAAYSGFSFDASVWEMTPFITCGATLHVIPDELRFSPEKLNEYFNANDITITNLPTQFCEQFMENAENGSLKTLVTGGDKLRSFRPAKFRLVNEYGPTEYTISATAFVVDKKYDNIPIGKPLANTWLYVVDKNGSPAPIGVAGELCISGAQMARGYLNRPELTKEKFIANPFKTCDLNATLYRTGDLVKWTADGNVEFLGRIDQQVKIRGYRIELGEIEQQLLKTAGIRDAVVVDLTDPSGNKYLCAYLVTADGKLETEGIKKALLKELPEYMVPAHFITLDKIPLTPNGKIDKKALPSPEMKTPECEYVEPSTEVEMKIAKVWMEVLGLEKIGARDNFFTIGGNSIKAIAAVSKLSKCFDVSINNIFEHQVLFDLAKNVRPKQDSLKIKLASIMDSIDSLEGDIPDKPEFKAEYDRALAEYTLKNRKYLDMDLAKRRNYKKILLSGATGFLGAHILRDLIFDGGYELVVIVRGKDHEDAGNRVRSKLRYYFGESFLAGAEFKKVKIYKGDLALENLGLAPAEYEDLSRDIDSVIHSAANVRHYGHYDEFFRDNVGSTTNLLKFSRAGKIKDFNYVSTVSVASGSLKDRDFAVFTEYDADCGQEHDNYYLKTKFLAEKEVIKARESGLRTSIFRVGNIVFDSESGLYQENIDDNAFYNQVKSYLNIGAIPDKLDDAEFSFVNYVSRAICLLFDRVGLDNEAFHIWNPESVKLSELLTDVELDLNVERLDLKKFVDRLYDNYDRKGMAGYIEHIMTHLGWLDDSGSKEAYFSVMSEKTEMLLKKAGFEWPRLDLKKLSKMIAKAFSERVDFLKTVPIFAPFSDDDLVKIAGYARQKVFKNSEDLLWEGVYSGEFFVVMDGFVEICRNSVDGWTGTLMIAGPQSVVGEENLVLNASSSITAEAIMGDSLVLSFNFGKAGGRVMNNPAAMGELLKVMAEKITRLEKIIVSMG